MTLIKYLSTAESALKQLLSTADLGIDEVGFSNIFLFMKYLPSTDKCIIAKYNMLLVAADKSVE